MRAIVIGSGISGLTTALYLIRAGHTVTVLEQFDTPGGVTGAIEQDGYTWDLGQLLLEGFGPGEPVGTLLEELGLANEIELIRDDRTYAFPDFVLDRPDHYAGPNWRRDRLIELFPDDAAGLARYQRFYVRMMEIATLAWRAERAGGLRGRVLTARTFAKLLPVLRWRNWSADRLMRRFFRSERLRAVFMSILADFVAKPSEFPGLGIPAVNPEPAFDARVPLELSDVGRQPSYHYIRGGVGALTARMIEAIEKRGGRIRTGVEVERILVSDGAVRGVVARGGERLEAACVAVSGGARESLVGLTGREHFDADYLARVDGLSLMESVFMVHLGIDFDPSAHQRAATCYYYGTYDIEQSVDELRRGVYHEGRDGFVVYVPSMHSPTMAPPGHHALTVYTVAPNRLEAGSFGDRREALADLLLAEAERFIPGLRAGTRTRVILTPEDFRARTFLRHHAFGGTAPKLGAAGAPHVTPVAGLYFIGAQSESGAGMNNVMQGAWRVARKIEAAV